MPRKQIRRFLPSHEFLKGSWVSRALGNIFDDPYLFHLNKRSVSLGAFIGLFWTFMPVPTQMVPAAFCAFWARANVPISVAMVWISNPITLPPIMVFCYTVGASLLGIDFMPPAEGVTMAWFTAQLVNVWKPLLLGCLVCGLTAGTLGYWAARWYWVSTVRANWKQRLRLRAARLRAAKSADSETPTKDRESR